VHRKDVAEFTRRSLGAKPPETNTFLAFGRSSEAANLPVFFKKYQETPKITDICAILQK